MSKLLLIDDDVELANMLKEFLTQEGFTVSLAHDGVTAEQYVLAGKFDLVILDVMMPGQDGMQTLKNIRQHSDIPVIMLTLRAWRGVRMIMCRSHACRVSWWPGSVPFCADIREMRPKAMTSLWGNLSCPANAAKYFGAISQLNSPVQSLA